MRLLVHITDHRQYFSTATPPCNLEPQKIIGFLTMSLYATATTTATHRNRYIWIRSVKIGSTVASRNSKPVVAILESPINTLVKHVVSPFQIPQKCSIETRCRRFRFPIKVMLLHEIWCLCYSTPCIPFVYKKQKVNTYSRTLHLHSSNRRHPPDRTRRKPPPQNHGSC